MMQLTKLLQLSYVFIFITVNASYGSSVIKPLKNVDNTSAIAAVKYLKANEFIHLSPKKFSAITGKKMNVLNTLSFYLLKMRVRQDYKRNHDLWLTTYFSPHRKTHIGKGGWIAIGILAVIIILGLAGLLRLD